MYTVYKHTCPNGKVYIGISNNVKARWNNGYGYKDNGLFFKDILKYGWDNITHDILKDNLTREEALQIESAQITLHRAMLPQYGYNIEYRPGLAHCRAVDQYTVDGQYVCTFESIGQAAQAVTVTPSSIHRACTNHGVCRSYLWKFSDDTTELVIPDSLCRRVHNPHKYTRSLHTGQSVAQYNKNGELIRTYQSIKEAHQLTGINQGDICSCCKGQKGENGRVKHSAGGFIWKYADIQKEVG